MKRLKLPALLTLSIFLMAGVYHVMWTARPDYFRVQSGVNFLPLDLVQIVRDYSAYSISKPLPDLLPKHKGEAATNRIEEIYQKFQLASVSLAHKKSEYAGKQQQDSAEYKAFEKSQFSQVELFIIQKTAPFTAQISAIDRRMRTILIDSGAKSSNDLAPGPLASNYANLNVELKRAELQKARVELQAREYAMTHLTDFQQQPSQKEYLARSEELEDIRKAIIEEQASTDKLRVELYDAFVDYRTAAEVHLGYFDFLYFSVGAATTATFGDISPNSTPVRMFVCLQVLGSILVTGLMVSELASRHNTADRVKN